MRVFRSGVCAVLLSTLAVPLLGQPMQNAPTGSTEQNSQQAPAESAQPQTPSAARPARRVRQPLCWREAGISPAAMNQRWKIEDNAKGKISAVCSNGALTPDQRRGKIREINAETEQEIAKIIPAKQLEAFKSCQAEQDREKAKRSGKTAQKELGPCGGVIPEQPSPPEHSHEHPQGDPSKQ